MKKILLIVLAVVALGGGYGIYLFNKKPLDTRDVKADYELSAPDLLKAFNANEDEANKKYVDKVISVSGKISSIDAAAVAVILDAADPIASVTCSFYANEAGTLTALKAGDDVIIKGKCTGKLMDVVLNECSVVKK